MNQDSNKNQTFAEKLKEVTELMRITGEKVQSLVAQARITRGSGDKEKADKLMSEAEMCLEITSRALQEFETKHSSEFNQLKSTINSE